MKKFATTVIAAAALFAAGSALAATSEYYPFAEIMSMKMMDKDKDGMVSKKEFMDMMSMAWDMNAKKMNVKGDKMTPDHEPQNALMTYLSDLRYKNMKPFKGTSVENYTRGQGICLNMHEDRHKQTRTYGGSGTGTKNEAIAEMTDNLDKLPVDPDLDTYRENARKVIAKTVKGALKKDHAFVTDIYNNSPLPQKTKNRLDAALTKVKSVNKAAWPETFSS